MNRLSIFMDNSISREEQAEMNRLLAIRLFASVVEIISSTRTADWLDVSSTTISKLITKLESSLAARLLHKTTRKLSTTDDGLAD